ncbi:hypothetical protein BGZ68_006017 [Mortierella alpina]|nr:hypothetical protein BGZ68_006017 [Mortierella alpina]
MQTTSSNAAQPSCNEDAASPEQEYDRYKDNPELLVETMPKASRMFSFDWTFPSSQLTRAIGVDLDLPLLEACRDSVINIPRSDRDHDHDHGYDQANDSDNGNDNGNSDHNDSIADADDSHKDIRSRLELYHGDLTAEGEPLTTVLGPPRPSHSQFKTMNMLIQESSHLFVYLLPEALAKLGPLLLKAIECEHKVVLSMRWEIPMLDKYRVEGGSDQQFYIYSASPLR